ncbi:hypothetical protein C8U37_110103 [Trichococcus patagoniensis]|uniref:Uncharacterized protein n=1 Tax=Trichococcus patagoniensis TaxID=382641 RepID=A0A2T5IK44_9LACT|nr:hypothetical protein [Trichococcus patagoniensis]PTQ84185.1 hypothetical protein C8U37_110103 [Trichococcus patagoniensis]
MIFDKITPEKLDSWSKDHSRRAQEILPELVARLVLSSSNKIKNFHFPYGKGIQYPGYDGYLVVDEATNFFPAGTSVFEFGTNGDIQGKFDEDIKKRSENSDGLDIEKTAFIFVSSKIWNHRTSIPKKITCTAKLYNWKEIKIIDAQTLCMWIDNHPGVSVWLMEIMNCNIHGVSTAEKFWDEKIGNTSPNLTYQFFINNRDAEVKKIEKWISTNGRGFFFIKAESAMEATFFLIAAMNSFDIDVLQKVILVSDSKTWGKVISMQNKDIILVPTFSVDENISCPDYVNAIIPISKFIPLANVSDKFEGVEIYRFKHDQFQKSLLELGVSSDIIFSLEKETKRCFLPLYRNLSTNPIIKQPGWLSTLGSEVEYLIPLMLLNYINIDSKGDLTILEMLTNVSNEKFLSKLDDWTRIEDFPVVNTGKVYRVVSIQDMWLFLGDKIKRKDIENLREVIMLIFSETIPKYDLPKEQRLMANIIGKQDRYSKQLIEGLLISLIFLKERDTKFLETSIGSTDTFVTVLLRDVMNNVITEKQWLSIAEFFPLITEASPKTMIDILKKEMNNLKSEFWELFKVGENNSIFSGNVYHHIIWGIERLVWIEEYAVDAILILTRLAHKKLPLPSGNTPDSSLNQVFYFFFPQTALNKDDLTRLLGKIIREYPQVGLKLVENMISSREHSFVLTISKPEWIEFNDPSEVRSLTYAEIKDYRDKIVAVFFNNVKVGKDTNALKVIFENLDFFYHDYESTIKNLVKENINGIPDKQRAILATCIRKTIFKNKKYSDAKWLLPIEIIKFLEEILPEVEPSGVLKYLYLCEYSPPINNPIPYSNKIDFDMEKDDKSIHAEREIAISKIFSDGGIGAIIEYCKYIEDASGFSRIISEVVLAGKFDVDFLLKISRFNLNLFRGIIYSLNKDGLELMFETLKRAENIEWKQEAEILSQAAPNMILWVELESKRKDILEYYWRKSPIVSVSHFDEQEAKYYLLKLVEHGRVIEAINSSAYSTYNNYETLLFLLVSLRIYLSDEKRTTYLDVKTIVPNNIQNIFHKISQNKYKDIEIIGALELYFNDILSYDFYPQCINEWIGREPEVYVQIIENAYSNNTAGEKNRSSFYRMLNKITTIPGCNKENIDKDTFNNWVKNVVSVAQEKMYVKETLWSLGTLLSYSPNGDDDIFPHQVIRDFFEENMHDSNISEFLVPNFITGKINQQGMVANWGSVEAAEENIANKYNCDANTIRIDFPETASILRRLRDHYNWSSKNLRDTDEWYFD